MRRRNVVGLLAAVAVVAAGCRTTAPRVPGLSAEVTKATQTQDDETRVEVSLGTVTLSTPKFTPIASDYRSGDRLDFGELKKTGNLLELVRKANVGISNTYHRAAGMSLALALAGTQVYAHNGLNLNSAISGRSDPAALLQQMMAGEIDPENFPVELAGNFGLARNASYAESFESPGAPAAAALPTLSSEIGTELLKLLTGSADSFRLDPFTEIKLVAALHNSMVNTEAYYNFDDMFSASGYGTSSGKPDGTKVWAPYRAQFNVAVQPGWYSQLNQFDALVDVKFPGSPHCETCRFPGASCGKCQDGRNMRVIAVVPQEGVQVIDEISSALEQVSLAASLSGSFKTVGLTGAYQSLAAAAQRLEGFRKNTTHLVSYPDTNTARIRIRPAIVPSNQPRELQPQSMLFTAFVLVEQNRDADVDSTAKGPIDVPADTSLPGLRDYQSVEEVGKADVAIAMPLSGSNPALDLAKQAKSAADAAAREAANANKAAREAQASATKTKQDLSGVQVQLESNLLQNVSPELEDFLQGSQLPDVSSTASDAAAQADAAAKAASRAAANAQVAAEAASAAAQAAPGQPPAPVDLTAKPEMADARDTKADGVRHGLLFNSETCVQYRAAFEPGVRLKNKRRPTDAPRPYYHAPKGREAREARYYVTYDFSTEPSDTKDPDAAWRPLPALLPPYRSVQYKEFGFNEPPFGFFDCVGNELVGYVAYNISNPPIAHNQHPPRVFYSTETNGAWHEFSMQDPAMAGAMKVHLGAVPSATVLGKNAKGVQNTITDYKARFFLMIRRTNLRGEYETDVHEVILPHRAKIPAGGGGGGNTPVINITDKGVSAEKLPVEAISPELAAILSNGHVILHPSK